MPSKVRTITEPQTIYILGCCGWAETDKPRNVVRIYDDESTMDFYAGDKRLAHLTCFDGAIYIFNQQEMMDYKSELINSDEYPYHGGLNDEDMKPTGQQFIDECALILRNFSGDILISLQDEETGECFLNNWKEEVDGDIYEQADKGYRDADVDAEHRVILPEGTTIEECHLYEVIDDLNGGKPYMDLPWVTDEETIYKLITEYDAKKGLSFERQFAWRTFMPAWMGFLIGKGFKDIVNPHMTIYVVSGVYEALSRRPGRPVFFDDFVKDLRAIGEDPWKLYAEYISSTDHYIKRFNEKFYLPLQRPLDEGYERNEENEG